MERWRRAIAHLQAVSSKAFPVDGGKTKKSEKKFSTFGPRQTTHSVPWHTHTQSETRESREKRLWEPGRHYEGKLSLDFCILLNESRTIGVMCVHIRGLMFGQGHFRPSSGLEWRQWNEKPKSCFAPGPRANDAVWLSELIDLIQSKLCPLSRWELRYPGKSNFIHYLKVWWPERRVSRRSAWQTTEWLKIVSQSKTWPENSHLLSHSVNLDGLFLPQTPLGFVVLVPLTGPAQKAICQFPHRSSSWSSTAMDQPLQALGLDKAAWHHGLQPRPGGIWDKKRLYF